MAVMQAGTDAEGVAQVPPLAEIAVLVVAAAPATVS